MTGSGVKDKSLVDVLKCCGQLSEQERIQLAFRLTRAYDGNPLTALAENYAEEALQMQRAPRGQAGYDGVLPNKRKLQVKSKAFNAHRDSQTYVTLSKTTRELADDLLIVFVDYQHCVARRALGPIPLVDLCPNKQGRYFVSKIAQDHPGKDIAL